MFAKFVRGYCQAFQRQEAVLTINELIKIAYTISPNIDRWINVWLQSDILVRLRRGCNLCVILASVKVGLLGCLKRENAN